MTPLQSTTAFPHTSRGESRVTRTRPALAIRKTLEEQKSWYFPALCGEKDGLSNHRGDDQDSMVETFCDAVVMVN